MRLIAILFCTLISLAAVGSQAIRVVSVYDGDTFTIDVDDWPEEIGKTISVRIRGIDAPELRTRCEAEKLAAEKSRFYLAALLRSGPVTLKNIERGKYFRLVADVYVENVNIAEAMIAAGYAKRYDGGSRQRYCDSFSA